MEENVSVSTRELNPVLTEGQWERVLTTEDIPELDPDASAALVLWKLGWFGWGDAFEHRRIHDLIEKGVKEKGDELFNMGVVSQKDRGGAQARMRLQGELMNLRMAQAWHGDMANRIAALLPPPALVERLSKEAKEREANESEGVEKGNSGRAGPA
jgi:hypothetical protein